MTAARRIITRGEIGDAMHCGRALDQRHRCHATIALDGAIYRCARADHEGIHDAFATHSDGGEVRW